MFRGFVSGLFWGGMLAVLGLAVVSIAMPLPGAGRVAAVPVPAEPAAPAAVTPPAPVTPPVMPSGPVLLAPPVAGEAAAVPATGAETEIMPVVPAPSPLPALAGPGAGLPPAPPRPGAEGGPPGLVLPPAPVAPVAPVAEAPGAPVAAQPVPPALADPAPAGPAPVAGAEAAPPRPAAEDPPAGAAAVPAAPASPAPEVVASGPVILPPAPVPPAVDPGPVPVIPPIAQPLPPVTPTPPAPAAEAAPLTPPGRIETGRSSRLPQIGGAAPEAEAATAADLAPTEALRRNARPFANPEGKPPFAVLLLDSGAADLDLAALAGGDLALTLVVDPTAPDAAERAARWHAAGQEVALLASALPKSGNAADMEVALETLTTQFPQALAVVDLPEGGLQSDRMAAAALVPALRARGFGLVTWDRGVNAADQLARRDGLPAATIFRDLDAGGEAAPVIRRYLDRAAFKAQQDGRVLVIGQLRAETLAAVMDWALEGRGATSLAPAPLSGLLGAR